MCSSTSFTTTADALEIPDMRRSEVADRLQAMKRQEDCTAYQCGAAAALTTTPPPPSPQSSLLSTSSSSSRAIMCDWCFQMVDACHYRRETVEIAMSYLDRFLATSAATPPLSRPQYQLAAITCLHVAIKLHEEAELSPQLLAQLSRGEYSAADIVGMEQRLLHALQWRMCAPTRLGFVQYFLVLLPRGMPPQWRHAVAELARFQTELATSDDYFVTQRPSHVALACILNALETVPLWNQRHGRVFRHAVRTHGGGCDCLETDLRPLQTRLLQSASAPLCDLVPALLGEEEEEDEEEEEEEEDTVDGMDNSVTNGPFKRRSATLSKETSLASAYSPVCVVSAAQQAQES